MTESKPYKNQRSSASRIKIGRQVPAAHKHILRLACKQTLNGTDHSGCLNDLSAARYPEWIDKIGRDCFCYFVSLWPRALLFSAGRITFVSS
jgi:hypothetical protein